MQRSSGLAPSAPDKEPSSPAAAAAESSSAVAPTSSPAPPSSGDSAPRSDSSPPSQLPPGPPASSAPTEASGIEPTDLLAGTGWKWVDKPVGDFKDWTWCPSWLLPEELRPPSAAEATKGESSPGQSSSARTVSGQEPVCPPTPQIVHRVGSKVASLAGSKSPGSGSSRRQALSLEAWEGMVSSEEKLEDQGQYRLELERGGTGPAGRLRSVSSGPETNTINVS